MSPHYSALREERQMGLISTRARATALSMGHRRLISLLCGLLVIGLLVTASYSQRPGRWTRAAPMPEERTEVAVAELAGKVYVVGGFADLHNGWNPVDTVFEYDPTTDQWRQRANMPTARGALAVGVIDGKIHAVGEGPAGCRHEIGRAHV